MIRNEVKAAISKVSSSVDLGQGSLIALHNNGQSASRGQVKSRQNLIKKQQQRLSSYDEISTGDKNSTEDNKFNSVIVTADKHSSSLEELQAIEHLKKARQLRRLWTEHTYLFNKSPQQHPKNMKAASEVTAPLWKKTKSIH